jgi:hypothetical protein
MKWTWVKRSHLDLALAQRSAEANASVTWEDRYHRLERDLRQEQDLVAELRRDIAAYKAEANRNVLVMADLAAELGALRSEYAALALTALKAPADPAIPVVSRDLDKAIRAKATGKNHRAALWDWAKQRRAEGRTDADITGAILDGDADEDLLIQQEAV